MRWSGVPSSLRISTVNCDSHSKGFSIVSEAEVDNFSGILLLFSMIQWMLVI